MKPILYIDLDGVVFGYYGDPACLQLRPGVRSFLTWACRNFECRILTGWGEKDYGELVRSQYLSMLPLKYVQKEWHKADAVDMTEDFLWIEDRIEACADRYEADCGHCHEVLNAAGQHHRFIYVDEMGEDNLIEVRAKLTLELEKRGKDVHG